jgi:uncharacterized membrane protein SpoIIM required for sporulation
MTASFFLLYVPVTALSYFLLPEGVLRGKHPIISRLHFSSQVWIATLQIFGYNLIPTALIIAGNLLAQESRLVKKRYVPIGYTAFWGLTALWGVVAGSWSYNVAVAGPPLLQRYWRLFDVLHHAGLLEFSAYLVAAAASFNLTLWYSDRRKIVRTRRWSEVALSGMEKSLLMMVPVLLFCAAFVESRAIAQLSA